MRDIRVRAGATECSIKHPPCCPRVRIASARRAAAPPRSINAPFRPLLSRNIRGAIKTQNFGARHAPGILRPAPLPILRRAKRGRARRKGRERATAESIVYRREIFERSWKSAPENRDGAGPRAYAAESSAIIISARIKLVMEPIISPRLPVSSVEFHSWRRSTRADLNFVRIETVNLEKTVIQIWYVIIPVWSDRLHFERIYKSILSRTRKIWQTTSSWNNL